MLYYTSTHLVRTRFGDQPQIGNVDGLLQGGLVGHIEEAIEWNVFEDLVDSEFMGIEQHCCLLLGLMLFALFCFVLFYCYGILRQGCCYCCCCCNVVLLSGRRWEDMIQ